MNAVTKVLKNLPAYVAYVRKALINVTGLVLSLLSLGLLPSKYASIGATVVAVLTVVSHYLTPNAEKPVVVDDSVPATV